MYRFLLASVFTLFSTITAIAQEIGWIQVEAQPTLTAAQDRARAYSTLLDNVNGYYLGGSWYGIALGPYGVSDAEALMRQLKSEGTIPRDSFIA
ncbi:MAG: peptidoglycan-binding protein, partial [Rhodobacteraceae bacterium]|nr:peptidoglycan-binding protein [Paracoccaceae bacterium]